MELGIELDEELNALGVNIDRKDLEDVEINKLRDLRNKYNDLAREVQKQIDKKVLNLYNIPDIINKYICIRYPKSESAVYLYVKSAERLSFGINIKGPALYTYDNFDDFSFETQDCRAVNFGDIDQIEIISKEEFNEIIRSYSDKCHNILLGNEI